MAFGLPGGRGPNLATEFALPNQGSVSQTNSGPQGGLGPKYLIIPGKRPGLYWYAEDEFVPQPVVVVDEDVWINGPAGQFAPPVRAVTADDELARLGLDDDYWLINQHTPFVFGKAVVSDEDVLPQLGFDEDLSWIPQQSRPFAQVGAITSDDDVFPITAAPFGLDEDYQWSNTYAYALWNAPLQAVSSDEDVWVDQPVASDTYAVRRSPHRRAVR